jgi:hypothetical protein
MYGYPTQTIQETVDSLEMVRQLFELGVLQSGFWHQFAMTAHSPVGMFPEEFGVIPEQNEITFANNDINFKDKTGINHDKFSFGLKKSLFNYMHGICLDYDLQDWFDFKIPKTKILSDFIYNCLEKEQNFKTKPNAKIVWIGGKPQTEIFTKSKKGKSFGSSQKLVSWEMMKLTFHNKTQTYYISVNAEEGKWLIEILEKISVYTENKIAFSQLKSEFEQQFDDFELFWYSKPIMTMRQFGLLTL